MRADTAKISAFVRRLHAAVDTDAVVVSGKAAREAAEELHFERADILDMLRGLVAADFSHCVPSRVRPGDLLWVFTPEYDSLTLWIRLVERHNIIVVSSHEG